MFEIRHCNDVFILDIAPGKEESEEEKSSDGDNEEEEEEEIELSAALKKKLAKVIDLLSLVYFWKQKYWSVSFRTPTLQKNEFVSIVRFLTKTWKIVQI